MIFKPITAAIIQNSNLNSDKIYSFVPFLSSTNIGATVVPIAPLANPVKANNTVTNPLFVKKKKLFFYYF